MAPSRLSSASSNTSVSNPTAPSRTLHRPAHAIRRPAHASRRRRAPAKSNTDPLHLLAVVVGTAPSPSKFACPICASTFGRRCELKRHVAEVHTLDGARRFACQHPNCGKSFTRRDALAKHKIVKHQGERKYVCPTCSEKFTSRYDLTRHNIRVHSNVKKRFTCEFCAAGFSQKSQLTMHKGRVHSHPKTPTSTTPPSTPHTPESSDKHATILSLAAVAVAMAEEEEEQARRSHLAKPSADSINCSRNGPPTQERAASDQQVSPANRSTPTEEAAAAAHAADTLLEAAAAMQPVTTEVSFTTNVTDEEAVSSEPMDTSIGESDMDQCKSQSCPHTPSTIVE